MRNTNALSAMSWLSLSATLMLLNAAVGEEVTRRYQVNSADQSAYSYFGGLLGNAEYGLVGEFSLIVDAEAQVASFGENQVNQTFIDGSAWFQDAWDSNPEIHDDPFPFLGLTGQTGVYVDPNIVRFELCTGLPAGGGDPVAIPCDDVPVEFNFPERATLEFQLSDLDETMAQGHTQYLGLVLDSTSSHLEFMAQPVLQPALGTIREFADCNADGVLDAADLGCIQTVEARDHVLDELDTLPGDLDGNGDVSFRDFLVLSENFGMDPAPYSDGNIDLMGGVDFADFLVLTSNYNGSPVSASTIVPEPCGATLIWLGFIAVVRYRPKPKR